MMENYTKEKWEALGFLESVPEDRKDLIVKSFNFAINWLCQLGVHSDEDTGELETITLPIILRITLQVDLTEGELLNTCRELYQQWKKFDRTRFPKNIDPEAAFCKAFGEMKINQYKNQNKLL